MQITKTKYSTYFFREHHNTDQEENTFSAFIPEGKKGFWILMEDTEKKENVAKIAVTAVAEAYFSNNSLTEDNMTHLLNVANKEIIESKIKRNMDYYSKFSTSIVAAEDDKMIVGNIGNSKVKIFRDNELIEEIEGDTIVSLDLKKYDYILSGTSAFWEIVNENDILDMFIRNSTRFGFENELSQKVNNIEIQRKIEIPFLSIFVENLEKEEYPVTTTVMERVNPLNYILPILITVFFITAVGKTIYNSKTEKQKKQQQLIEEQNKNKKVENTKIVELVKPENFQPQIPAPVVEEKLEKVAVLPPQNEEEKKIEKLEQENQSKAVKLPEVKREISTPVNPVKKQPKREKSNTNVKPKTKLKPRTTRKSYDSLDEEIRQNWKKLGRDNNGNVI
ncbi:hypothetical protein [Leptotrichia buccalis]|uniref:PPM-type phosphatase domain-containing protein n=1 Tax=Leptotrichia buccalis (strain ATCC 14201 / DSM 1135 / JCM 12969 / NCTC 10249 / C-1013-b) TaxID=523794 RepID=C7N9H1_LEPBD|nr:hypothetical protein [Leptotrichia buccalis]ACV38802.1 hypothetical protein Lebu_0899 [Leptotrichia buccalis C-1013-b]